MYTYCCTHLHSEYNTRMERVFQPTQFHAYLNNFPNCFSHTSFVEYSIKIIFPKKNVKNELGKGEEKYYLV